MTRKGSFLFWTDVINTLLMLALLLTGILLHLALHWGWIKASTIQTLACGARKRITDPSPRPAGCGLVTRSILRATGLTFERSESP